MVISVLLLENALIESLFLRLSPHASVLSGVFGLAERESHGTLGSARDIARLVGVSHTRISDVISGLRMAESLGAIQQDGQGAWRVTLSSRECKDLALMLRGACLFKEQVHKDQNAVRVVMSKPAEPSKFFAALESTLEGAWGLASTAEVLGEMAARASARFSIMTPFVDESGAQRVLELFAATNRDIRRELIVRNGLPESLHRHTSDLNALDVRVFDFRLSRLGSPENETFHAKVIRIDDDECYVGSSNMTKWSFDYSLELGLLVNGKAGEQVSRVIDAVLKVCKEISPPN